MKLTTLEVIARLRKIEQEIKVIYCSLDDAFGTYSLEVANEKIRDSRRTLESYLKGEEMPVIR